MNVNEMAGVLEMAETFFVAEVKVQRYEKDGSKVGIEGHRLGFGTTEKEAVKDLEKAVLKGERKLSDVVVYRSHADDKRLYEGERPAQVAAGEVQAGGQAEVGKAAVDRSSNGRNIWAS